MILSAQVLALVRPDFPLSGCTRVRCTIATARSIARKGVRDGVAVRVPRDARFKGGWWQVQYHWNCERPFKREHVAIERPYRVDLYSRCRKCKPCMDNRSRLWMGRAGSEYRDAARTYLGTFTLAPEQHALIDAKVAATLPIGKLTPDELFRERTLVFGGLVDGWLNRIRAGAFWRTGIPGGAFRYLLVAERHDSEKTDPWMRLRPHFHILLHEQRVGALVEGDPLECMRTGETNGEFERRMIVRGGKLVPGIFVADSGLIRKPWEFGFSKFELCFSEGSAVYVCKYLTKTNNYRVRASIRYGQVKSPLGEPSEVEAVAEDGKLDPPTGEN